MINDPILPITELALAPTVRAFFTLRGEYIANNHYSSFNVCDYTGDDFNHIESCRDLLCDKFNITRDHLILPRQTHSVNVATIDKIPYTKNLNDIDAIVTSLKGVVIGINTADCVPILLYDEHAAVIGAAHSGWRGTINKISSRTISEMEKLGAIRSQIKAFIGVSICSQCFEVGDEVVAQFKKVYPLHPEIILSRNSNGKHHIDLQTACHITLTEEGICNNNIFSLGICSHCNSRSYFSARREGIHSGRTLTAIMMTDKSSITPTQ